MTGQPYEDRMPPRRELRWRWYHFYFLLAVFDLLVILSTLAIYHQTLAAYQADFNKLNKTFVKQRWVIELRLAVLKLNAPGNDVFASRNVTAERGFFDKAKRDLDSLVSKSRGYNVDLYEFTTNIESMIQQERKIFELLAAAQENDDRSVPPEMLERASRAMATMDRHQADALTNVTEIEQGLLANVDQLLGEIGILLIEGASREKYFFALVVLILLGTFWYGRKLQRMHEQMITDQQRAFAAQHERLAAVGELCAAVAHGIRNPLAAISSSAQLEMTEQGTSESTRGRLGDILTECRRLDERVTQLLGFASTSADALETYDLRRAVDQSVEEVYTKIRQHGIELTGEHDDRPLNVRGQRERMVQTVIELIANAMNHVPPRGRIKIACRRCDDTTATAVLDIIDNGPGIPEAIRARVFDLFFTTRTEGTGIGLASVRHTVQLHGGIVSIIDRPEGTHIRIRLPLV